MDLKKIQKEIYQNKVDKGFNVTDVNKEFCLIYGEVAEAYEAWKKHKDDLGEELADVAIYLLGLSEILGINLEDEISKKVYKNSKREYKMIDGINTRVKEFGEESESNLSDNLQFVEKLNEENNEIETLMNWITK